MPHHPFHLPIRTPELPGTGATVIYLAGCALFSLGAYLFIHAGLGTDPLDVFSLGLLRHVPATIGIAQALVAIVCLGIVAAWTQRRPLISPLFTFFFCGSLIDILRAVDAASAIHASPVAEMVGGTLLCAYGSALIIMSGFGIRAMDLLAIQMTRRWGVPFWSTKGVLEALLLLSGWLMGGPVGVGTLAFLLGVNGLVQPMMWANTRLLHIDNLGLPPRDARAPLLPV